MLPGQIFENNCSTVVLIAQKKKTQCECLTKIKVLVRNKESIRGYFKLADGILNFLLTFKILGRET